MLRYALLVITLPLVSAYYHGAPCQALYSLFPNHDNILMQNSSLQNRYLLQVSRESDKSIVDTYKAGETYRIRLSGTGFRGFLMQIRHVRDNGRIDSVHRLGKFVQDDSWEDQGIKMLSCSPVERADSITHSDNHRRESIEVLWRPEIVDKDVQVIFTVVEEKERFWTNQMFPSGRLQSSIKREVTEGPVDIAKKSGESDSKNLRRKPPRLPTRKPVTTREETPPKQKPTSPIASTTASGATESSTTEQPQEATPRFHQTVVNVSSEEILENTVAPKFRALNLTAAEGSSENKTLLEFAVENTETVEKVETEETVETTTVEATTVEATTVEANTVVTTPTTVAPTTESPAKVEKEEEKTNPPLSREDLLIERIFGEIKQIILEESVRELNGSARLKIPKLAITVEKEGEAKETTQLEYILQKLAVGEDDTSSPIPSTLKTTPSTQQPTTTTPKPSTSKPISTTKVSTTTTAPAITTEHTEEATEAETSNAVTTTALVDTTTNDVTTTILAETTTPATSPRPTKAPTSGPPLDPNSTDTSSKTHPKCDRDYWMECKDWSDSECELIWVRQNCRKKCCDYLLKTLYT